MLHLLGVSVLMAGLEKADLDCEGEFPIWWSLCCSCLLFFTLDGCPSESSPLYKVCSQHGGQRGDALKVPPLCWCTHVPHRAWLIGLSSVFREDGVEL